MVDDDVSTLLKLDQRGFHAGGTVQAGSRPLFVASGGFTVNPPDLSSVRGAVQSLVSTARDRTPAPKEVRSAAAAAVDTARDALPAIPSLPDAPHLPALPDMPHLSIAPPDAGQALRSAGAEVSARLASADPRIVHLAQAVGLVPHRPSLLRRATRWLPALGFVALGTIAAAGVAAWFLDPLYGRARRHRVLSQARRVRTKARRMRARIMGETGQLVPIPVERRDPAVASRNGTAEAYPTAVGAPGGSPA